MKKQVLALLFAIFIININQTYANWNFISDLMNLQTFCVAEMNNNLFLGSKGMYSSTDNGYSWHLLNNELSELNINCILTDEYRIFAGTNNGLYQSNDFGKSFKLINLANYSIEAFFKDGNTIYLGAYSINGQASLKASTDHGENWENKNNGIRDKRVTGFAKIGNRIFISTYNGTYYSDDSCNTWILASLSTSSYHQCIAAYDNTLYTGTFYNGAFKSTDQGITWTQFYGDNTTNNSQVLNIYKVNNKLLLNTKYSLIVTEDNGLTWDSSYTFLDHYPINNLNMIGDRLFVTTNAGVFNSSSSKLNFNYLSRPQNITSTMFKTDSTWFVATDKDLLFSSDNGKSWESRCPSLQYIKFDNLEQYDDLLFVINYNTAYASNDLGKTWSKIYNEGEYESVEDVYCFAKHENKIFAGTNSGVFISEDSCQTWEEQVLGLPSGYHKVNCFSIINDRIYTGFNDIGMYFSDVNKIKWKEDYDGIMSNSITDIETMGDSVYVIAYNKLYFSSDTGYNWSVIETGSNTPIISFLVDLPYIFVSTGAELMMSDDNGLTWKDIKQDLITTPNYMFIDDSTFYGATEYNGLISMDLKTLKTLDIKETKIEKTDFSLYPNPCTDILQIVIDSDFLFSSFTKEISVYNLLGELIFKKDICSDTKFSINISDFQKGLYFVKIGNSTKVFIKS